MFLLSIKVLVLIGIFSQNVSSFKQLLQISEGFPYNSLDHNGIILTDSNENIKCMLNVSTNQGIRGMWLVHDEISNFTGQSIWYTDQDDIFNSSFSDLYRSASAVRRLGPSELTDASLSLYEGLQNVYPFSTEHTFTEESWTGEPFPLNSFAVTGGSSWTLYEGKNFTGKSYCLEAIWLYRNGNLNPLVISSVKRGCDSNSIKIANSLPFPQSDTV